MNLPDVYEGEEVLERITEGLLAEGYPLRKAREGARIAQLEAPFAKPDEEGWRWVCNRARAIAGGAEYARF